MTYQSKKKKYNNKKVEFNGIKFDSKAEYQRYVDLLWLLSANKIKDLQVHKKYPLIVNGVKVGQYESDFEYFDIENKIIITEEIKSFPTSKEKYYRLKNRLFLALYPEVNFKLIIK